MKEQPKKEARSERKTEPKSGTVLTSEEIKGQKDSMSSDFFHLAGRYIARFDSAKKTVYRSPDINTAELQAIHVWATRKFAQTIIKCADDSDFMAHGAGGDKLIESLKDVIAVDVPPTELEKIAKEVETTAFDFCKDAVGLLHDLAWKIHILEEHEEQVDKEGYLMSECDRSPCRKTIELLTRIDKELFHGTMEDLTGVEL